jgi:hypothetical protein
MRLRFSIRWLLLVFAALAAFCWRQDLPRQRAAELAAAVNDGDYDRANRVFSQAALFASDRPGYLGEAELLPRSPADWLCGRQFVSVRVDLTPLGIQNVFGLLVTTSSVLTKEVSVSVPSASAGKAAPAPLFQR